MANASTSDKYQNLLDERDQKIGLLKEENSLLREKIRLLIASKFGSSSERLVDIHDQLSLFEEKETKTDLPKDEEVIIDAHKRKKSGRKPLPEDYPHVEIIHDLSDEEKISKCCSLPMEHIASKTSKKYRYKRAEVIIEVHIRPQYVCPCDSLEKTTIVSKPMPPSMVPKGVATPSLLAQIMTSKFVDAVPFYRQVKCFERIKLHITRATMSNWALKVAEKCQALNDLMLDDIRDNLLIQMDETWCKVLNEKGRANRTKSWMWVIRGGPPDRPIIYFDYDTSRESPVAKRLLDDFQGYFQSDAWRAYDWTDGNEGLIHCGCWDHARRRFADVVKAAGGKKKLKSDSYVLVALRDIRKLYKLEAEAKEQCLDMEQTFQMRQEKSRPLLKKFKKWLEEIKDKVPPKSKLGDAINYTLTQWPRLTRFLTAPMVPLSNILTENAIRPFVIGRKNWLFSGSPEGARASAAIYSIVETAKANGREPYSYLENLFEKLPYAKTEEEYRALLPNVAP